MKMDTKGQISVELMLLISFALISAILLANSIFDANELNMAMASARDGALEGISSNVKGKDSFNRTRIQLKIYASSPNVKTKEEKEAVGDRINYNVRKSITQSFKSENITNKLFNPAFSNKYSFTTANVVWV